MKYKVLRIDEDLDFGCEERAEDAPVLAVVLLEDESGGEKVIKVPDADLYKKEIEEGDFVEIRDHEMVKSVKKAETV